MSAVSRNDSTKSRVVEMVSVTKHQLAAAREGVFDARDQGAGREHSRLRQRVE